MLQSTQDHGESAKRKKTCAIRKERKVLSLESLVIPNPEVLNTNRCKGCSLGFRGSLRMFNINSGKLGVLFVGALTKLQGVAIPTGSYYQHFSLVDNSSKTLSAFFRSCPLGHETLSSLESMPCPPYPKLTLALITFALSSGRQCRGVPSPFGFLCHFLKKRQHTCTSFRREGPSSLPGRFARNDNSFGTCQSVA